ncbi:MAG: LPXTG cell wall anchor domain-containing protein [Clostridia bacterium]|nr:LPXTG cell wall anchor domain-containing protein [Clostridia bacterium]
MNKRNVFVRGMAIFLVVILIIGVVAVGISALAAEDVLLMAAPSPDTGSRNNVLVFVAIIAALILMAICIILPKIKKKDE